MIAGAALATHRRRVARREGDVADQVVLGRAERCDLCPLKTAGPERDCVCGAVAFAEGVSQAVLRNPVGEAPAAVFHAVVTALNLSHPPDP